MSSQFAFIIEYSIANSVPIFLASMVVAFLVGPFLYNVGVNKYARISIYSVAGVAAGMWSYYSFDAAGENIELLEATLLIIGMLIYSMLVIAPMVFIKNRTK